MLFQINSMHQIIGWILVFAGLVICNEIARRTKMGGIFFFLILPAVLTIYFIAIAIGAASGADWAVKNDTYLYMNGWFHYAKLYAATAGCVGGWWKSTEDVWLNGGWWNWVNGIAGILNIFCMTGWWGIYHSKDKNKQDMLWPDMTVWFIVAYDLWNFTYTYNNLPTHTWYCGLALLLAPTFANALWNKGGWIQNRANTLALWCMFAQVFPLFQIGTKYSVLPVLYEDLGNAVANTNVQGFISILALAANVICLAVIIKRSIEQKKNPYKEDIWTGTKDYEEAMARADR